MSLFKQFQHVLAGHSPGKRQRKLAPAVEKAIEDDVSDDASSVDAYHPKFRSYRTSVEDYTAAMEKKKEEIAAAKAAAEAAEAAAEAAEAAAAAADAAKVADAAAAPAQPPPASAKPDYAGHSNGAVRLFIPKYDEATKKWKVRLASQSCCMAINYPGSRLCALYQRQMTITPANFWRTSQARRVMLTSETFRQVRITVIAPN
jgi:hypothetical protein